MLLSIFTLFSLIPLVLADVTVTVTSAGKPVTLTEEGGYLAPTGVAPDNFSLTDDFGLQCMDTCIGITVDYLTCFLDVRLPSGTRGNITYTDIPSAQECTALCAAGRYNHLFQCLNCIIANGGENPEQAAQSAAEAAQPGFPIVTKPLGPIDLDQANGWLRNVSDFCAAQGQPLVENATTTVTAFPTTTGPYSTSFTSGETRSLPQWTGLTTLAEVESKLQAEYASEVISRYYSRESEAAQTASAPSDAGQAAQTAPSATPSNAECAGVTVGRGVAFAGVIAAAGLVGL